MKNLRAAIFVALLAIASYHAEAQIGIGSEDFNVKISPQVPGPFTKVQAEAISFTFDVNRAHIRWMVNGRVIAEGIGAKTASFETGGIGSVSTLRVVVSPQNGGALEKSLEIRPAAIDLLVESKSFVPDWYRGASLLTPGGEFTVTAIPHFSSQGARLKPETLNYDWKVDGRARSDFSGRGRQRIAIKTLPIQKVYIPVSVVVSSPQDTIQAEANVVVESVDPQLLFYGRPPLEGTNFYLARQDIRIPAGESIEIEAVPFFMNISSIKDARFLWKSNNVGVEADPTEPHRFIVNSTPGERGKAVVELTAKSIKNMFEEIRSLVTVYAE